jgi:hypothetical protein
MLPGNQAGETLGKPSLMKKHRPRKNRQRPTDEHALAIGRIAISWNEFQESLAELFARLFGKRRWRHALAAWQALSNDRAQRDMLRAVAEARFGTDSRASQEVGWLVDQAHQHLSDGRNTGIHMPLMVLRDLNDIVSILPLALFGNRRAKKMLGKDLLNEYTAYEEDIRDMSTFSIALQFRISAGRGAWPQRPQLRQRERSKTPKALRRQKTAK